MSNSNDDFVLTATCINFYRICFMGDSVLRFDNPQIKDLTEKEKRQKQKRISDPDRYTIPSICMFGSEESPFEDEDCTDYIKNNIDKIKSRYTSIPYKIEEINEMESRCDEKLPEDLKYYLSNISTDIFIDDNFVRKFVIDYNNIIKPNIHDDVDEFYKHDNCVEYMPGINVICMTNNSIYGIVLKGKLKGSIWKFDKVYKIKKYFCNSFETFMKTIIENELCFI